MESLLPLRLDVVTVLLLAVKAVNVLTSHRNIALSNPALATLKENFTLNILNELQLSKIEISEYLITFQMFLPVLVLLHMQELLHNPYAYVVLTCKILYEHSRP